MEKGDRIAVTRIGSGSAIAAGRGAKAIIQHIEKYQERALTAVEEAAQAEAFEAQRLAQGVQEWVRRLQRASDETFTGNPYKDLQEYYLSDADVFFGRLQAITELLEHLQSGPLTVLHSESGAGKTSLLHAGISPQLLANRHLPVYLRPYNILPSLYLKRAILPNLAAEDHLAQISLRDFLSRVSSILGLETTLYIFIDQFEEFFTQLQDEGIRLDFIRDLQECISDPSLNVRWLLSMRGEYFSNLADYIPRIQPFENEYRLRRLTRAEAEEVVRKPASQRGREFEAKLVDQLLDDLGQDQVNPPEIQLVCSALYKALPPEQNVITLENYVALGRADRILGDYLERVLNQELRAEQRTAARRLLEELVTEVTDLKRVIRSESELATSLAVQGLDTSKLNAILGQLVGSRLLRVHDTDNGLGYELAHDYLLSRIKLDPATLARKSAQELLDQEVRANKIHPTSINADRLAIIESQSEGLVITEEAKALLQKSKAALRRQQGLIFTGVGVLVVSIIVAAVFVSISARAQTTANLARTQQASIESALEKTFIGTGAVPVGAHPAALASSGDQLWVANQGDNTVQAIDPQSGRADSPIEVGNDPSALTFDGNRLWVANQSDHTVQAFDPQTHQTDPPITVGKNPSALIFDGSRLWTANQGDNTIQAIDPQTGQTDAPIPVGANPSALVFDGSSIWVANRGDNTVQAIDPTKQVVVKTLEVGQTPSALVFDGTLLWVANQSDNTIQTINIQTGKPDAPIDVDGAPVALVFAGSQVWVAHSYVQQIFEVDGTRMAGPPTAIPGVSSPAALLFDGTKLWIANAGNNTVSSTPVEVQFFPQSPPGGNIPPPP